MLQKDNASRQGRVLFLLSLGEKIRHVLVGANCDRQQKAGPFSAIAEITAFRNLVEFASAVENLRAASDNIEHVVGLEAAGVGEERAGDREHLEDVLQLGIGEFDLLRTKRGAFEPRVRPGDLGVLAQFSE